MHYGCGVDPCYHGGYTSPVGYGCGYPAVGGVGGYHHGFALIVVLFILLIIIGASYYCK